MTDFLASDLTVALEALWRAIQQRHPDVPPAVITVGSGQGPDGSMKKWGHYARSAWAVGESSIASSTALARAPDPVAAKIDSALPRAVWRISLSMT